MKPRKMSMLLVTIVGKRRQSRNKKRHSRVLKCLNAILFLLKLSSYTYSPTHWESST